MKLEQEILQDLESNISKDDAFIGFYYGENDQDNEHIRANKDGLKSFAFLLLKIAYGLSPQTSQFRDNIYDIDKSLYIEGEGMAIHYIELIDQSKSDLPTRTIKPKNWKDRLIEGGCIFTLGVLIICMIIGIYTVFNWIV